MGVLLDSEDVFRVLCSKCEVSIGAGMTKEECRDGCHIRNALNIVKPLYLKASDFTCMRHGNWTMCDGHLTCSYCGKESVDQYEFCPHCGARMN